MAATTAAVIGAVGAAASLGTTIAGAVGGTDQDAPGGVNYGALTRDAQQAQIDLLPAKTAAHAQYDPQNAATQQRIAYANLFGTAAGTREETYDAPITVPAQTEYQVRGPGGNLVWLTQEQMQEQGISGGGIFGRPGTAIYGTREMPGYTTTTPRKRTVTTDAVPGQLRIMEEAGPRMNRIAADYQSAARDATIADVNRLSPGIMGALRRYDPESTELSDTLYRQVGERLNAPGLDPFTQRALEQNIRSAQAARGFGYGRNDAAMEAYYGTMTAEQRAAQNRADASQLINQRSQLYGDPFSIVGGASARQTNPTNALAGYANPYGSLLSDPGSAPYQVGLSNQAAANQVASSNYNNRQSSLGSIPGQMTTAAGGISALFPSRTAVDPWGPKGINTLYYAP